MALGFPPLFVQLIKLCDKLRPVPSNPASCLCSTRMAHLTLLLAQALPPSAPPPSAPPPVHDFYGSGGYCGGWYTRSYAIDTYPAMDETHTHPATDEVHTHPATDRVHTHTGGRGAAFSTVASACLEKCMFDERCNALEVRGDACEYHTGAEVKVRAKLYKLDWPANNEPAVVSCWIKVPPGCNRECDLTQKSEMWHWFTLPTIMVMSALMLALIIRSCKSQAAHEAGGPTRRSDVEAPEAWEPPSQTMPTRIVPAGVGGGAQGEGGACAVGTTTAEMAAGAAVAGAVAVAAAGADVLWSDLVVAGADSSGVAECAICLREVDECAICLSEMGAGDLVLQLPCCHEFHLACFRGWEAVRAHTKQGRPTCPLCKADLSGSGGKQSVGPPCAEGQTGTVAPLGRQAPPTALEDGATHDAAAAATPTAAVAAASAAASSSAAAGGGHGGGRRGEPSRWSRPAAFRHWHPGWACSYLP